MIAVICDVKGRTQWNRFEYLANTYMPYLDVYSLDKKPCLKGYKIVYYANYKLFHKLPFKGIKLASVTSHKYNAKELKIFNGYTVNNRILHKELGGELTENGVDTGFWLPMWRKTPNKVPVIGWVGNKDRKAKRHDKLRSMMADSKYVWDTVETSKHDKKVKYTKYDMCQYYNMLDCLLVTSDTEGTPNPALEALSCGVPVVTLNPVGNLPDIEVGVADELKTYDNEYRKKIREYMVKEWDWSVKYKAWDNFFKRYL